MFKMIGSIAAHQSLLQLKIQFNTIYLNDLDFVKKILTKFEYSKSK